MDVDLSGLGSSSCCCSELPLLIPAGVLSLVAEVALRFLELALALDRVVMDFDDKSAGCDSLVLLLVSNADRPVVMFILAFFSKREDLLVLIGVSVVSLG